MQGHFPWLFCCLPTVNTCYGDWRWGSEVGTSICNTYYRKQLLKAESNVLWSSQKGSRIKCLHEQCDLGLSVVAIHLGEFTFFRLLRGLFSKAVFQVVFIFCLLPVPAVIMSILTTGSDVYLKFSSCSFISGLGISSSISDFRDLPTREGGLHGESAPVFLSA